MICDAGSGGVNNAENINSTTIAYFLYFLINAGVKIPNFVRKNESMGNSKTKPSD